MLAALALVAALAAPGAHAAAAHPCRTALDEVRFDDGRLLVLRRETAVNPRTVRERWWACWRPSGRRSLLDDRSYVPGAAEGSLVAVRRGHVVVLTDGQRLDAYDGRKGRLTGSVAVRGALRELAVTTAGRLAALEEIDGKQRVLLGGSGTRSCLLDAGAAQSAEGDVFGELSSHGERVTWQRDGTGLAADLAALRC